MKVEWNNCFLCLNDLTGQGQVSDSRNGDVTRDSGKHTRKIELLFNYLLTSKSSKHSGVISDIKQLLEGKADGGSGVNFCTKCEGQLTRVSELHRELEVVQMKLVSVLKAVKATVLQNSKKNGGGNMGLEIFEQWLRDQEISYAADDGNEEKKTRLKTQRRILETLEAFQDAVTENEKDSIDIPLVFLERCTAFRTPTSEQLLPTPQITVKTEIPDLEDYFDTPMPDHVDDLSNVPRNGSETEAPKPQRKYKKRFVEIQREVLHPPGASTSTTCIKLVQMSNRYKHKKKEPPSETDMSRPPSRKKTVPPAFQKKPHSKLRILTKEKSWRKPHLHYCCALCPFTIQYLYSMEAHLQSHENEAAFQENPPQPQFQCDQCPSKFRVEQAFQFHMLGHTGHYRILCEPCNTWQPPMTFKDHMKTHLEKTFPCPNCSFSCTTREKYINHLFQYHRNSSILECDICGWRSSERCKFLEHYYTVHQAIEKRVCGVDGCTKAFLDQDRLTAHKVVHTGRHRCSHCDRSYLTGGLLKEHLASIAGDKIFPCDACGECFTRYTLQRHKIEKHGVPRLQCEFCEKEFIQRSRLNAHRRLHTGEGLPCEHPGCGKVFESKDRLRSHMNFHSTERNFVCDLCGAALKTKQQLERHKLGHAGEDAKKLECPQCGKKFLFEKYLANHLKIHRGDRPYICGVCGKGFNQASALSHHKLKCFLGPTPPVIQKRDERAKGIKLPPVDNQS